VSEPPRDDEPQPDGVRKGPLEQKKLVLADCPKECFSVEELVVFLGLKSRRVVYKWIQMGTAPPYYKPHRRVFFNCQEVVEWLRAAQDDVSKGRRSQVGGPWR
jgi:hypothetical protein